MFFKNNKSAITFRHWNSSNLFKCSALSLVRAAMVNPIAVAPDIIAIIQYSRKKLTSMPLAIVQANTIVVKEGKFFL